MKIDKNLIKELTDYLDEFGLTELEYEVDGKKIKVSKSKQFSSNPNIVSTATKVGNKSVLNDQEDGIRIKSPIIGTAYLSPEPGAKKFVEIGQKIKKGQTVMIVEAMKTMNHIPSTQDGEVVKILVNDGQPVEFGQSLILLK